jgi:small subunit ribosomal protein S3
VGQKVNPVGFRIGIIESWRSNWFSTGKDYTEGVVEDTLIRDFIRKKLRKGAVSKIEITRLKKAAEEVMVTIHTARPGVVIGRKGAEVDLLKNELEKLTNGRKVKVDIKEVRIPELDANLVAQSVADQIEARVSHRRAMKRAMTSALRMGAKGIRISCAGRLGGAEIARREWYREGRVPLHTLRAQIDYGFAEALTKYGRIGVKVWIYKGDFFKKELPEVKAESEGSSAKEEVGKESEGSSPVGTEKVNSTDLGVSENATTQED